MADIIATTTPLLCRDVVTMLCKRQCNLLASITQQYAHVLQSSLLDMFQHDFCTTFQVLRLCSVPILIAGRKRMGSIYEHTLLIDVRHLPEMSASMPCQYWIIDMESGALVLHTTKRRKMPQLILQRKLYKGKTAKLADILQVSETDIYGGTREPTTLDELIALLTHLGMADITCVEYIISFKPFQAYPWYRGNIGALIAPFTVYAYTKSNLDIGYCFHHVNKKPMPIIEDKLPDIPNPASLNRRSSVSVKLKGLCLAHALGVCCMDQMQNMSLAMSSCVGALWITCDDEKHARYMTYKDNWGEYHQTLVCSSSSSDDVWLKMFNHIEKQGVALRQKKNDILQPVLQVLNLYRGSKQVSPWTKCLQQLKQSIIKHNVYVFCTDDTILHLIKTPFAGFCNKPKSNGVLLHTLGDNSIAALSGQHIRFINLAYFFNYKLQVFQPDKDDDILWELCQDWLPANGSDSNTAWINPCLLHKRQTNKRYRPVLDTPMTRFLKQRNERNAQAILNLFSQFVLFNTTHFGFDITTIGHVSMSKMAFDIVWLEYAKQAGPMAHPVEKMHPYIEYLLRPWCKGGFSFSCKDHVASDQPLEEGKDIAACIREYDLTSAYGASGSNMATAKGFGQVFKDNMLTKSRWCTFEYRAVMYTLYKWMHKDKKHIRSVFSNFSPLGVLMIGKYPVDLVAIMEDGSIHIVQFDGHYVHGDYNHPECLTLSHYVGNSSRQQCEEKTKQRDQATLDWMVQIQGHNITYSIITDCCHAEYTPQALRHAFATIPQLSELIDGICDIQSSALDQINLDKTTFIAQVTGHATHPPNGPIGPIFNQDGMCFQDMFKSSGTVLLTSDYYQYLKQFGFRVEAVDWVVFYQRCFDLPQVFRKLVHMRTLAGPTQKALLKTIVNVACGYFGLNCNKGHKTMARISHRIPRHHSIFKHHVLPLQKFKGEPTHLITTLLGRSNVYMCPMPLILFACIIEYGKMMLNRALQCLQKHLHPASFRFLYCNVDNMIIASSVDDLEDATLDSSIIGYQRFLEEFDSLKGDGPGLLKEEWCITTQQKPWQFVSPGRMQYCIANEQASRAKSCVVKGVSPQKSFQIAMAMLNNVQITVNQTQTINKLAGPETHIIQYNL